MCGQYQHLGYLDVRWRVGSEDSHVGDVIARQWLDAFVDVGSTVGIAVEADVAEVSLHQSRLQVGHADGSICHVNAQTVGECLYSGLCGTVDIAAGIGCIASHRPYVDDVSAVAFHHGRHHEARHGQQTLDVGVYHRVPVIVGTLILWLQTECQAGIVHQHVDSLPFGW